jgi:hypothetical protein
VAQIERDALDDGVPVATALRKCIALGGKSGSAQLRDWATRELQGYSGEDELPDYRTIGAPLFVDAIVGGNVQVTHQQFPPSGLPDVVREHISEQLDLRQGAGTLEAYARQGEVRLQPPGAGDLARLMNIEGEGSAQHIVSLYWGVSPAAIEGVLDQVRTALTQLVAELQANMSGGENVPSAETANQAVNLVVTGKRARVQVTSAQASGVGTTATAGSGASAEQEHGFWTRWRRIGAFVVGTATIVGAIAAIITITQ